MDEQVGKWVSRLHVWVTGCEHVEVLEEGVCMCLQHRWGCVPTVCPCQCMCASEACSTPIPITAGAPEPDAGGVDAPGSLPYKSLQQGDMEARVEHGRDQESPGPRRLPSLHASSYTRPWGKKGLCVGTPAATLWRAWQRATSAFEGGARSGSDLAAN